MYAYWSSGSKNGAMVKETGEIIKKQEIIKYLGTKQASNGFTQQKTGKAKFEG